MPVFNNYLDLDGLPSTTLYDMVQDRQGALWIATDNGISRFDGTHFRNYGPEAGLNDVSIIHLYRDRFDRIWGLGYNGTLSCIEREKVVPTGSLNAVLKQNLNEYIDKLYIDSIGQVWLATRNGGVYLVDTAGNFQTIYSTSLIGLESVLYVKDFGDDIFISVISDTAGTLLQGGELKISQNEFFIKRPGTKVAIHRNAIRIGDGNYLVSYRRWLAHIRDGEIVFMKEMNNRIIDLSEDLAGKVWVSVFSEGLYHYDRHSHALTMLEHYGKSAVSKTLQDTEGTYWFSTTGEGLYRVADFDLKVIGTKEDNKRYKVVSMTAGEGTVYFTTYDQSLYAYDLTRPDDPAKRIDIGKTDNQLFDIHYSRGGHLWITGAPHRVYLTAGRPATDKEIPSGIGIEPLRNGRILLSTHSSIIEVFPDFEYQHHSFDLYHRIFDMFEDAEGNILIGSMDGLFLFTEDGFMRPAGLPHFKGTRITALGQSDNLMVAGTVNDELYLFNKDTAFLMPENLPGGLGRINCLLTEGDSIIWAGTNTGLIKFSRKEAGSLDFSHIRYMRCDGLPSDRVNDLLLYEDMLWVGTDQGMAAFHNRFDDRILIPPEVRIESFEVNGAEMSVSDTVVLSSDKNDLRFTFEGISLKGRENIHFRFMLSGHDRQIIFTKDNFVNYSNLAPGEYRFFFNAGNNNGNWSREPDSIFIVIERPFTSTVLYYLLVIAGLLVVVSLVLILILREQKRRARLNHDLLLMQQQLLRTQMNPHFIFNSLLAIQNFVYKNEPSQAARYLSRFAKLIRLILNSSRKEYITLEEEVEFLTYYLELQKLRFKQRFEYRFEIDEKIQADQVYIPPMLAQPFIENAIEHGLKDISHQGILRINFYQERNELVFKVEDNGIGIYHSLSEKERKVDAHESLGQQITYERLRLLNKRAKKVSYSIEELKDEQGVIHGTRITFRINI